jgi:ADP-ribosylglycohydrolase
MAIKADRDRALGAYIGGAVGDAMGGPVEGLHAARIGRVVGEITSFLAYKKPWYRGNVGTPGGALHGEPGSVTDDTFLRAELTRYFLNTDPPRTADRLARYFIEHANRDYFWYPKLEPLDRIARGEVEPAEAGWDAPQGGGAAWWTPLGILHGGDPAGAAQATKELCRIWKAPLEQDILSSVQAAVAEGLRPSATVDSMMEALLSVAGPLARKLFERGLEIGRSASSFDELWRALYQKALMPENVVKKGFPESAGMIRVADAPMPPTHPWVEDTDEKYATNALAEQMPLAAAVFVFAKGEPRAICQAAMLGRDADSIATTVGSWVGALNGLSGLPVDWVETVSRVNLVEVDIRGLAEGLLALDG